MGFQSIKRILPTSVAKAGIMERVSSARAVDIATTALARLWDAERATHVTVVSLKDGVLKISVDSPSAAHALRTMQNEWLNEIHRALGERRIRDVRIERVGF